jgi:hypothetical protein
MDKPENGSRSSLSFVFTSVFAFATLFVAVNAIAFAQGLGTCKTCGEYDRACRQAHSKEACQSELEMCLKHCSPAKPTTRGSVPQRGPQA